MLIILGDFNAKIGKEPAYQPHVGRHSLHTESNDNGQRLAGFAATHNLKVVSTMFEHKNIHKETWVSNDNRTRNQIDHVLVNARYAGNVMDVRSRRGADADSDHFLVHAKIRLRIKNIARKVQQTADNIRWETDKLRNEETRKKYQAEIESMLLQNRMGDESVETRWGILKSIIVSASGKQLGKRRKTTNKKAWYDKDCEDAVNRRNERRLRTLKYPSNENIESFKRSRNEARKLIRQKKRAAQNEMIERVEENARRIIKKFFREIAGIRNGYKPATGSIIRKENSNDLVTDDIEVLKIWQEHFNKLLNASNRGEETSITYQTAEIQVDEPTMQETTDAINRLKNNKAPGGDTLPAELLKKGGTRLHEEMHKLMVTIWNTEMLPEEWKTGIIIPIHKKGDRLNCVNYRGITLLNSAYKILSNILLKRISPYAEDNIGDYQCGFRSNRSTVDQIFTIRQLLEKSWEFNKDVHQLFIDFKQAYDTIIRENIWIAMESMGIPKKLISLTKLCVNNTELCVKIGNQISNKFTVKSGLKQGDGLSPLLFNIVLDMVIKKAAIDTEVFTKQGPQMILAFADDIDAIGKNTVGIKESFLKIEKESQRVGLKINEEKTKYMHVARNPLRDRVRQNVTMDTYNFESVQKFKYLGAFITSNNDMTEEIKARIQSGNRCFFSLQPLMKSKTLSRTSKIRIYQTIIKPVVCYGCETWTLTKHNELLLQRFERKILRKIFGPIQDPATGQYRIRTNAELETLYHSPNIIKTIKSQRLRWAGHVQRSPNSRLINMVWNQNPTGTRPLGRPRLRWRDNIIKDLQTMNVNNWREAMMDRDQWRQIVFAARTHPGL